jgi:lysophospholipase L1-like esterase
LNTVSSRRRDLMGILTSSPTTLFLSGVGCFLLWVTYMTLHPAYNDDTTALLIQGEEDLPKFFQKLPIDDRCWDDGDPPEWRRASCECTDPLVASQRPNPKTKKGGPNPQWVSYHDEMVEKAATVPDKGLDVLLLGDSITERWMGSKALGKNSLPRYHKVFRKYFDKSKGASLEGVPFGAGGDTTYELLWNLQHDLLPDNIQPKAILLLIGTNDLSRVGCSKTQTLAGILNVAHYVHGQRPRAYMIVHGLLPRNDVHKADNFTLGYKYQQIQWINRELQRFCAIHRNWFYLNNSEIFLQRDHSGEFMINKTLMDDALHPSVRGYDKWGPYLVRQITDIFAKNRNRKKGI